MSGEKVIVAMSGGVDSSVAALLLKEAGYRVEGVTMRLYNIDDASRPAYYKGCCSIDDVEDARWVCRKLGVPHHVFNVQREFQAFVIDYFCQEYQRARTPHPCLACNEKIKFQFLLQRALFLEADYVATGHYARITRQGDGFHLYKALDARKDQSYVLYAMGQEELAHTLMPVGNYTKDEVRRLARQAGLPNADKPDSQEICFIPWGDYRQFLAQRIQSRPGDIVDSKGNILGHHDGIEFFTVGQRRGLGITTGKPMFVVRIEAETGRVVVGPEEELYSQALWASQVKYTQGRPPQGPVEVTIKVRYKSPEVAATLFPRGSQALVRFSQPLRAVTPGQAAVFYCGEEVLGGGIIEAPVDQAEVAEVGEATQTSSEGEGPWSSRTLWPRPWPVTAGPRSTWSRT